MYAQPIELEITKYSKFNSSIKIKTMKVHSYYIDIFYHLLQVLLKADISSLDNSVDPDQLYF